MKAIITVQPGDTDQLVLTDNLVMPTPDPYELLIRVKAAGVNRADILQREGKYPPPSGASSILGLEIAGIVEAVGAKVSHHKVGDRIFGLLSGGGYAEFATIHEEIAMRIPDSWSFEEAAAIPEVFLTAFQSLFWLGELQPGEKVLIHAGASGVGTAAIQLVLNAGAYAFVSTSAGKLEKCTELGAIEAFDYKSDNFWDQVHRSIDSVNLIVDPIGGDYFPKNLKLLSQDGRLVMLSVMGGLKAQDVNLGHIVFKRLKISGSTLRSRDLTYQIALTRDFNSFSADRFARREMIPVIDSIFPWTEVSAAHRHLESNSSFGKIIITID